VTGRHYLDIKTNLLSLAYVHCTLSVEIYKNNLTRVVSVLFAPCKFKGMISPVCRDDMKWSRDGTLANQMSRFLFYTPHWWLNTVCFNYKNCSNGKQKNHWWGFNFIIVNLGIVLKLDEPSACVGSVGSVGCFSSFFDEWRNRVFRASVESVYLIWKSRSSFGVPQFEVVSSLLSSWRIALSVILAMDVASLWSLSWIYRLRAHNRLAQTFCARWNLGVAGHAFHPC
jgi:hypothetical protein